MFKMVSCRFYKSLSSLTCWMSKGGLKRCFLESGLTGSLTVCNFRNKIAMTIIFFSKILKCDIDSKNWLKKWERVFRLKDNCIWIGVDKFSQSRKGYCHWLSMCYERSLRFNISLREIFLNSGSPRVMEKYDVSALMQIWQDFGTL